MTVLHMLTSPGLLVKDCWLTYLAPLLLPHIVLLLDHDSSVAQFLKQIKVNESNSTSMELGPSCDFLSWQTSQPQTSRSVD
jgi:hypothetical protein